MLSGENIFAFIGIQYVAFPFYTEYYHYYYYFPIFIKRPLCSNFAKNYHYFNLKIDTVFCFVLYFA